MAPSIRQGFANPVSGLFSSAILHVNISHHRPTTDGDGHVVVLCCVRYNVEDNMLTQKTPVHVFGVPNQPCEIRNNLISLCFQLQIKLNFCKFFAEPHHHVILKDYTRRHHAFAFHVDWC